MFLSLYHHEIFRLLPLTKMMSMQKVKVRGKRSGSQRSKPNFSLFRIITPVWIHIWQWDDAQSLMLLRRGAYCFSRSSIKFQGYMGQNIADFYPSWGFPDCNSSLNSPMALKWCKKLKVVKKRCPIVFQGHSSNFNVIQAEYFIIWFQFE